MCRRELKNTNKRHILHTHTYTSCLQTFRDTKYRGKPIAKLLEDIYKEYTNPYLHPHKQYAQQINGKAFDTNNLRKHKS